MKKGISLLIVIMLLVSKSFGQKCNKKYFINTNWFANNLDSAFYKVDTVKLIQHNNYYTSWGEANRFEESELGYLGHGYFVEIGFRKKHVLQFNFRENNSIIAIPMGDWTWSYKKKKNLLTIWHNGGLYMQFRPISEKEIKIPSAIYTKTDSLLTRELTVKSIL